MFKSACIVGLGYVGLPTALLLADRGVRVIGVEKDSDRLAKLRRGDASYAEAQSQALLSRVLGSGALSLSAQPVSADVFVIAVPTPLTLNHQADLSFVYQAAESISAWVKEGDLVILESTVPVGTTEKLQRFFLGKKISLCYSPERILPGNSIHELVNNDRIVGGLTLECATRAVDFYRLFVKGRCHRTSLRSAELTKLAENAFRDVNIAFANELDLISQEAEVDVFEVIALANCHPRVAILQPGIGVGGHCVAVDPWFLVDAYPKHGSLIRAARERNLDKTQRVLQDIEREINTLHNPVVACFGLAYKPNVGDCRMSPALSIVRSLATLSSLRIMVVEPHIRQLPKDMSGLNNLEQVELSVALDQADVLVMLVCHDLFFEVVMRKKDQQRLIDCCGMSKRVSYAQ